MKRLLKRRERLVATLLELAPKMLVGSASETYRTCGTPTCSCHTTGPKHGPHLYVSYMGERGRTTGYYVPEALHAAVREGLAAWKDLRTLAKELAQLNREILYAEYAARMKRDKPA
jgi:hypothetical protein